MRIKNISFFALFALFLVFFGFCYSSEDFSENFGINSSADFSVDFDKSSQVFALSNFDKKLLENGSLQGYVVSEKLDGVRALWDGVNLKSRSGKAFSPPKCWVENLPDFALDGELFIARGKFEEVLSVVSKGDSQCEKCKCEEWSKVGYFIFDVPQANQKSNTKSSADSSTESSAKSYTLLERLALLESWLENRANKTNQAKTTEDKNSADLDSKKDGKNPILHIIPQESVPSQEALQKKLKEVEKLGGEGLVIRKNNAPYERFRTTNAMKLKSYSDTECVVVAHNQGKGKFSHALGSLTCESLPLTSSATTKSAKNTKNADSTQSTSIDSAQPKKIKDSTDSAQSTPLTFPTHSRKIRFKIGSGFSDKDRAAPPPIGTTITYKYYGLTKNGLPRFPVFLRVYSP
ncbi:hypothetical protein [Helicobacter sp. MIT 01-3238]|uniref:ATP-dependent DNA ligase n=1 Tax=Helicobacter sp. MIT 01-3238 TaxID=398627 RepID=UPI0015F1804D